MAPARDSGPLKVQDEPSQGTNDTSSKHMNGLHVNGQPSTEVSTGHGEPARAMESGQWSPETGT